MPISAWKQLTRNPERLQQAIKLVGKRRVAMEPLRMYFPTRWVERNLAVIEEIITVLGYVAFVTDDGAIAVTMVSGFFRTEPDRISNEVIEGETYTVFWYNKGSNVIVSNDIVKIDNLVHPIYSELEGKGRIPGYFLYADRARFFANIPYYNGVDKQGNPAIWSYLSASASRDPDNPSHYYRHRRTPLKDQFDHPPVTVGLNLVSYHASSLFGKQGGSYYDAGTTSALANPSTRAARMERTLTQT